MSDFVYVILDIGRRYIRAGPAGLVLPYVNVANRDYPISSSLPSYLELNDTSLDKPQTHEIIKQLDDTIILLKKSYHEQLTNWMNSLDVLALHNNLLDVFRLLVLKMSTCRVIILDNGISQMNKYLISKILLLNMGVRSTQFVTQSILSVISSNTPNGLVVNITWSGVLVSSIVDYRIVNEMDSINGLSGENLHFKIIEELIKEGSPLVNDKKCFDIVQLFVLNYVFCGDDQTNEDVTIEGFTFRKELRNTVIESFLPNVVEMMIKAINRANMDAKPLLFQNIIFDGGMSNIRGLKNMIMKSISSEIPKARAIKCLGSWQGGSIYFSTSITKRNRSTRKAQEITKELIREITKGSMVQLSKLPDNIGNFKYIT